MSTLSSTLKAVTTSKSATRGKNACFKITHLCRLECYNGCNKAYFPELACVEKPEFDFYYKYNHFDKLYLFKRPDPKKPAALKAYN